MIPPARTRAPAFAQLPPLLLVTVVTLFAAYIAKQGCFVLGAGDTPYCYSDYAPVYTARELAGGRFPYDSPPLEYPAGLGLVLWLASAATSSTPGFVQLNMAIAAVACLATVWMLWRLAGRRAILFAAAPSVVLYAFLNWDLIALVCAVAAIASFLRHRDLPAGLWLGLGASIKLFPALLVVPFVAQRLRESNRNAARRVVIGAAAAAAAVNIPVAWAAFDGWTYFFQFNSARVVDWGSLWMAGSHILGSNLHTNVPLVNWLSLAAFLAAATLAWLLITRTAPGIPRWQLAFPLLVVFFLTNKVYSPQYSLWILPWFALVLPSVGWFLVYEAVDIAVYVTSFGWQQRLLEGGGLPQWPLDVVLLLRAIVLIGMLVAFARAAAKSAAAS
ncbi:MAG TPA: glycosyltransferase 87 family protein [Vicinamibacterales bacterium]|nr:glycosyltransferase 87 family protein [Vicinamibacterales bacterium]